jgi:endonuclease YncB( thermonuclease family)
MVLRELLICRNLLLLALYAAPVLAVADVAGRVVGVADGDTMTLLDESNRQYKVRLAGIDAPEKRQAFGHQSKKTLGECAFGKSAVVEGSKVDRYGRLIGKVVVDGVDCNLRQIEVGLAWHYKRYAGEQKPADRTRYDAAEVAARGAGLGLWHEPIPTPPWNFRRSDR